MAPTPLKFSLNGAGLAPGSTRDQMPAGAHDSNRSIRKFARQLHRCEVEYEVKMIGKSHHICELTWVNLFSYRVIADAS
jgi:hypothetical protein